MAYGNEPFARLKRLLVDHGVTIMMAGDTHDLEYYVEPPGASTPAVHYFVNGGGGAYLSLGTALEWPDEPPTAEWAFYPSRDAVARKIELEDAVVEAAGLVVGEPPACLAVPDRVSLRAVRLQRGAVLSELRRGSSRAVGSGRVRLLPYGVHGRLRWRDLSRSAVLSAATGGARRLRRVGRADAMILTRWSRARGPEGASRL